MKDPILQYCQLEDIAPSLVNRFLSRLLDDREVHLPWFSIQLRNGLEAGDWERAATSLVIAGRLLGPGDSLHEWKEGCTRLLQLLGDGSENFLIFKRCIQFLEEQWSVFCSEREKYGQLLAKVCRLVRQDEDPEKNLSLTYCNLLSLIGTPRSIRTLKQLANTDIPLMGSHCSKLLWRKWDHPEPDAPEGALSYQEARQRVLQEINHSQNEFVLLDEFSRDVPCGWVFYYTTQAYFECGEMHLSPLSNGPIIFNRFNQSHFQTQPDRPIEYYLDEYERNVLGMKSRWSLRLQDSLDAETKLKALKIVRAYLGLSTSDAFAVLAGPRTSRNDDSPEISGIPLTLLKQLYLLFNNELIPCKLGPRHES